ncbi:MAG: glycosyl hydrolase [Pseudomonadota bacterium]
MAVFRVVVVVCLLCIMALGSSLVAAEYDLLNRKPQPTNNVGVFVGNEPEKVKIFEEWLGRRVEQVLIFTGGESWEDFSGSVGWAAGLWKDIDRTVIWSVPLIPRGATLEAAAAGEYNAAYLRAAEEILAASDGVPDVYIRVGWEFNASWMAWSAIGKEQEYIGAFQEFVDVFRSVSDKFVFEWNVNIGDQGMNPEDAYPGDDYVDIIGIDFYYHTQYYPADPLEAWQTMLQEKYGLGWHRDFANARGKPMAFSEWGVMTRDSAAFVEAAEAWFEENNAIYMNYWNSDASFPGVLSCGQLGPTSDRFREIFGNPPQLQ